jgi:hypothetical protein
MQLLRKYSRMASKKGISVLAVKSQMLMLVLWRMRMSLSLLPLFSFSETKDEKVRRQKGIVGKGHFL